MRRPSLSFAALAALASQPALAEDYVFKGDCARADIIQSEQTIDKLLPYSIYEGIQRGRFEEYTCDILFISTIEQTERSPTRLVFNVRRQDVPRPASGSCNYSPTDTVGTVTFTMQRTRSESVCELYIWSNWEMRSPTTSWTAQWANRVSPMNAHSFAISQTGPQSTGFRTPLAFTGAP